MSQIHDAVVGLNNRNYDTSNAQYGDLRNQIVHAQNMVNVVIGQNDRNFNATHDRANSLQHSSNVISGQVSAIQNIINANNSDSIQRTSRLENSVVGYADYATSVSNQVASSVNSLNGMTMYVNDKILDIANNLSAANANFNDNMTAVDLDMTILNSTLDDQQLSVDNMSNLLDESISTNENQYSSIKELALYSASNANDLRVLRSRTTVSDSVMKLDLKEVSDKVISLENQIDLKTKTIFYGLCLLAAKRVFGG